MSRNVLNRWIAAGLAGLALAAAGIAAAQSNAFAHSPKVTLRMTSASPAGMEDSKAMLDAAAWLKKETGGTVTIQPFFSSALFDEIAGIDAAQSGLVDLAVACTCNMTKQTKSMLFSDVPYLWKKMDNGRKVWDGPIGDGIRKELTDKLGLIPVAFTPSGGGYRILWNNKHPIKVPADVKGIKIRTTATPLEQDFWKGLGAIPTPIDVKEIYSSLQHGLVDAEHLQPVWLTLLKHDEVVKYGTEIQALAVYRILVINKDSYDKMDAAQKQAFDKAMKMYEDKAYEYNRSLRDVAMKQVKARGIQVYTPTAAQMAQWRKAGEQFQESSTVKSLVPRDVIDRVLKAQS